MQALKEILESPPQGAEFQTLPPGFAKRRIWAAPEVTSHAAVVMTATKLYLIPGNSPPSADLLAAVQNGADPSDVFGALVTIVNLGAVLNVKHDLIANTVHLDAAAGSGVTGAWTSRATIVFATAESADALYAKLWRRLGDEFKLRPDRMSKAQATSTPLTVLAGILIATALLALASNAAADYGPMTPTWLSPFKMIDWRVITVLGGVFAAIVQVWMYRRLTQPPSLLELVKEPKSITR